MALQIESPRFDEFMDQLAAHPVLKGRTMLYGSSFFTNWGYERARDQMAAASKGAVDLLNHGFGGATVKEMLHYYDRAVAPYEPSSLILRAGPNDVMHFEYTAQDVWREMITLFDRVREDFPDLTLYILSVFDYPACRHEWKPHYQELDRLAVAYAASNDRTHYLNIHPFFYQDPKDVGTFTNFRHVFIEDGLHMTDAAYEEFARYFAEMLAQ